jgi:glutamine synthetase
LQATGVKYVMATCADGHGIAKCKMAPIAHLADMMEVSELFTGAALDLLGQSPADDELAVFPDPEAIVQLPWRRDVAFAPGNVYLRGEPYSMCPRTVLSKQVERAKRLGFTFNLGIETEFYFVTVDETTRTETASTSSTSPTPMRSGMADRFMLFRMMAKEVARSRGLEATFMPKPFSNKTGGGAHFNMSLASVQSGAKLFAPQEGEDPYGCGLSAPGTSSSTGSCDTRRRSSPSPARPSTPTSAWSSKGR